MMRPFREFKPRLIRCSTWNRDGWVAGCGQGMMSKPARYLILYPNYANSILSTETREALAK